MAQRESDEHPGAFDGEIPIWGYHYGEPVPDLKRLPQERWGEVLTPLRAAARQIAVNTVATQADVVAAMALVGELLLADGLARAGAQAAPPPMPAGEPPARGRGRQVNFRLGPREHARLVEAARLFGMRPTVLARVLTVRGVDRALYEERRDRPPPAEHAP